MLAIVASLVSAVLYTSRDTDLAASPVLLAKSFCSRRYGRIACYSVGFGCRSLGGLRHRKLLDPP